MSESTPEAQADASSETEDALRAVLRTRTGAWSALQQGLKLAQQTMGPGLAALVVYAAGSALGGSMAGQWGELLVSRPPSEESAFQTITLGVVMFLGVYAAIQLAKREQVTRASWWPVLFLTPLLTLFGAHAAVGSQLPPQIVPGLAMIGWDLLWESFGGAAAVFVWIVAANATLDGQSASLGDVVADLRKRLLDMAVVHGAKVHAVTIGLQLIVPGIFYALSLAYADQIVALDPERPALRRSSQLTYGMRGRLFRLLAVVFLVTFPLAFLSWLAVDGVPESGVFGRLTELVMAPAAASGPALFVQRLVGGAGAWVTAGAMLVLYREREAQVRAKRALQKLKAKSA